MSIEDAPLLWIVSGSEFQFWRAGRPQWALDDVEEAFALITILSAEDEVVLDLKDGPVEIDEPFRRAAIIADLAKMICTRVSS